MNRVGILFSALLIAFAWLAYYLNFYHGGGFSKSTEVWGQFGDYTGGVVNPILSFITIILLINSLKEQRVANKSLKEETERQEKLEDFRKFEVRFFNLVEIQRTGFDSLTINISGSEVRATSAVSYIEELVLEIKNDAGTKDNVVEKLEEIDPHDSLHSLFRRFYLIVKLIDSKLDGKLKEEYYEALLNLTDIKLISLICIISSYHQWDVVQYISASGILNEDGLQQYINLMKITE